MVKLVSGVIDSVRRDIQDVNSGTELISRAVADQVQATGDITRSIHEISGHRSSGSPSVFRITALQPAGGDLWVTWTTVGGRRYVVQTNGDVSNGFADFSPLIPAPGIGESVTNFVAPSGTTNGPRYYRVRLEP